MVNIYNIYCDESCHLEYDQSKVMVLGALWCPLEQTKAIAINIRRIKTECGFKKDFEIKWTKVSPARADFYERLIEYFFEEKNLYYRAIVIPDKTKLSHEQFRQDHDTWYYKMYFRLLQPLLSPEAKYRIYLDLKDTRSSEKTSKLHEVLCNNLYDFDRKILEWVQIVNSKQIEQIQLCDLFSGMLSYIHRNLTGNAGKQKLISLMQKRSGYSLCKTTLLREQKVNVFVWQAQDLKT